MHLIQPYARAPRSLRIALRAFMIFVQRGFGSRAPRSLRVALRAEDVQN